MSTRSRPALALAPSSRAVRFLSPARRGSVRGYTLLELVIVLAVIGVVATIGSVRYTGALTTYRLDAAAARVKADLDQAARKARATSSVVYVQFDAASNVYRILTSDEAGSNAQGSTTAATGPLRVDLGADPYRVKVRKIQSTLVGTRVGFNAYGRPMNGLSVMLSAGGRERLVSIDVNSSAVSVR